MKFGYEVEIFHNKPSHFDLDFCGDNGSMWEMQTMRPIWNDASECYELNFFG